MAQVAADGCDLIVAKSLGCWAAARAAEQRWPAVWLTPVLTDEGVAGSIRVNPTPRLPPSAVWLTRCGTRRSPAPSGAHHSSSPGLDHALSSTGDGVVAPDILDQMAAAIDDFLEEIA